ncbi:MAG: hypothetical protein ACC645_28840, partial [Pirellulales bacterium]
GERYVQTQIELLRSPMVLGPVLSRPEIAAFAEFKEEVDQRKYLEENLTIQQVGKSDFYSVGYRSPSPGHAAAVTNAVVAEYLSIQSDEGFRRSQRVIDLLEEERNRRSLDVERLRKHVLDLAKEVTGKDPFSHEAIVDKAQVFTTPMTALYGSLTAIEVNSEILKAEIQALRDAPVLIPDHAETSGQLDLEIDAQADIVERESQLAAIRSYMEQIKETSVRWESSPRYRQLKKELEAREAKLAEWKSMLREELHGQRMEQRKREHEQALATLQQELAHLDVKKKIFTSRFDQQMGKLKTSGGMSVQLEFARAELAREEKVFELIAVRKLSLQTELRAPARVRLRQKALVPTTPLEPVPYKFLVLGCCVALVAPLALAFAREATVRRITDVAQLAQESKLRVLGEVARFPVRPVAAAPRALPRQMRREMFIFAESIDSVRTNLLLSGNLRDNEVLAVSSAASDEGKTSVATSLAVSIAGATKKPTLVLDADLRSPNVAEILGTAA